MRRMILMGKGLEDEERKSWGNQKGNRLCAEGKAKFLQRRGDGLMRPAVWQLRSPKTSRGPQVHNSETLVWKVWKPERNRAREKKKKRCRAGAGTADATKASRCSLCRTPRTGTFAHASRLLLPRRLSWWGVKVAKVAKQKRPWVGGTLSSFSSSAFSLSARLLAGDAFCFSLWSQ